MLSRKKLVKSLCPGAPNEIRNASIIFVEWTWVNGSLPSDTVQSALTFPYLKFTVLPVFLLTLLSVAFPFSPFILFIKSFPTTAPLPRLSLSVGLGFLSQSRLARLVVGPFWGWNCTGGRPSVHWKTTHDFNNHITTDSQGGLTVQLWGHWQHIVALTLMRLCSGRLQAAMWSCRSCWEKFWCIWAASWASMVFPHALFRSDGNRALWIPKDTLEKSTLRYAYASVWRSRYSTSYFVMKL